MKFINTVTLSNFYKEGIFNLWNNEYPEKLNHQTLNDLDTYLSSLKNSFHILILDDTNCIKGWYVDFLRDNEKWFAIILDASLHRKGIGSKILTMAKIKESELNGWVIDHNSDKKKNGDAYVSPLDFYLNNGFKRINTERLELENISAVKITWKRSDKLNSKSFNK